MCEEALRGYLGERGLINPAMAVWMQAEAHRWKGDSFEKILNDLALSRWMPKIRFLIIYEFQLLMCNLLLVIKDCRRLHLQQQFRARGESCGAVQRGAAHLKLAQW